MSIDVDMFYWGLRLITVGPVWTLKAYSWGFSKRW